MCGVYLWFLAYFSCILHNFIECVDRSQFKKCEDSSFCKRHRQFQPGSSPFVILPNSVTVLNDNSITAILENTRNQLTLSLNVSYYGDSRVGITVDEINPLRNRYRASESFVKQPEKQRFATVLTNDHSVATFVTKAGQKILLNFQPFRLDVLDDEKLVLTLNSRELLKFEHFRTKKPQSESTENIEIPISGVTDAADHEKINKDEVIDHEKIDESLKNLEETTISQEKQEKNDTEIEREEENMWEEHFKSHRDSKPYGSSSVGMDISFVGFKHVYGLPEHADTFALKSTAQGDGEPYRLYNLDVFEYELYNPMALYGAVPFIIGKNEASTVGVLWLNPSETWIDIKSSYADQSSIKKMWDKFKGETGVHQIDTHWISETGLIDIYLFFGPQPKDIFRQYTDFFGTTSLPPLFSIGYHQCRWNYNDMDDVKEVDAKFDEYHIPYDTIWLDIEHTDDKKYFTWHPHKFSDPKAMVDNLASKCRNLVTIVDPHIKREDSYKIYKEANDLGYFVKNRDDSVYEGWCWPGASMYIDFLNPAAREWWAGKFLFQEYNGTSERVHIWNDMNEPSIFNGPEVTMYKDNKHYGGLEHRDIHNMYGFFNTMATYKGLVQRTGGIKRPFLLTRSFFVGSQRFAAVWTGDNMAEWSHLKISIPMMLSLGVGGIPFAGADVGGFFRNCEQELLVRWYQTGAFSPFFRAHAHLDTRRREPWLYDEEALRIIRKAVNLRYALLPYWYTIFYEHTITGLPVMRPLWVEFPDDVNTFDVEQTVFIGGSLLVHPVVDKGASSASVYLPGTNAVWYDWDTFEPKRTLGFNTINAPLDKIPLFIRGGTILPLKMRPRRSSCAMEHDPLTLYVALDQKGEFANGTYYFDDGETFEYKNNVYCYRIFKYQSTEIGGSITNKKISGNHCKTDIWIERIIVIGLQYLPKSVFSTVFADHVTFTYDKNYNVMTIRKPKVFVGSDWQIDIRSSTYAEKKLDL